MSGQRPVLQGPTTVFGLNYTNTPWVLYGQATGVSGEYNVLQHIAYFRPAKTGTYTFYITDVDDVGYIWFGDKAKIGYTTANNDDFNQIFTNSNVPYSYSVTTANLLIPFRFLYVNAQGATRINLIVTDPDGVVIGSRTTRVDNGQFISGCSSVVPGAAPFPF